MKIQYKHTANIKDALKRAEIITGLTAPEILEAANIKHLKSYQNRVIFFNFILSKDSNAYISFTLDFKHLLTN